MPKSPLLMLTKSNILKIIGGLLFIAAFMALGYYLNQPEEPDDPFSIAGLPVVVVQDSTEWVTPPEEGRFEAYQMEVSNLKLQTDNTLSFDLNIPQSPIVMESIFGSQLGKTIFQVPFQSFSQSGKLTISGIEMKKFNPFERIDLTFIYEYDDGVRARQYVTFEIK